MSYLFGITLFLCRDKTCSEVIPCRSQYNMLCWVFFDCTWLSLFYISSCSRWCCERTLISVIFLFKINNFQVTFMFQKYRYECTLITPRSLMSIQEDVSNETLLKIKIKHYLKCKTRKRKRFYFQNSLSKITGYVNKVVEEKDILHN